MIKRLIAAALLVTSVQAPAATVEVATGDWSGLPLLKSKGGATIGQSAIDRIHKVLASGQCTMSGQSKRRLDMTVPFAVRYEPNGKLDKIVMPRMNCAPVEAIVGRVLLGLVESGEYTSTGENQEGWYRSEISFASII